MKERHTVRILFRDGEVPGKLVGVVETEGVPGRRGFVGFLDLLRILCSSGSARTVKASRRESPLETMFRLCAEQDREPEHRPLPVRGTFRGGMPSEGSFRGRRAPGREGEGR